MSLAIFENFLNFAERAVAAKKNFPPAIDPAEFESVVANLPTPVDDVARFAYGSGWRKGEILPLRWDAVDRRERVARLRTSKNGHPRTLPLTGDL